MDNKHDENQKDIPFLSMEGGRRVRRTILKRINRTEEEEVMHMRFQ